MDKAQGPILQLTELFSSPAAAPGARPVLSLLPVSKETFNSMMITKWSFLGLSIAPLGDVKPQEWPIGSLISTKASFR